MPPNLGCSKLLFVNMLSFIFLFQTFAYRSSFENLFVCVVGEFVCVNSDVFMTKKMFSKTYVLYKIVIQENAQLSLLSATLSLVSQIKIKQHAFSVSTIWLPLFMHNRDYKN